MNQLVESLSALLRTLWGFFSGSHNFMNELYNCHVFLNYCYFLIVILQNYSCLIALLQSQQNRLTFINTVMEPVYVIAVDKISFTLIPSYDLT